MQVRHRSPAKVERGEPRFIRAVADLPRRFNDEHDLHDEVQKRCVLRSALDSANPDYAEIDVVRHPQRFDEALPPHDPHVRPNLLRLHHGRTPRFSHKPVFLGQVRK